MWAATDMGMPQNDVGSGRGCFSNPWDEKNKVLGRECGSVLGGAHKGRAEGGGGSLPRQGDLTANTQIHLSV